MVGNFTLTILALGRTLEEVQRASAEITKVFGAREASLFEETYNGLNAFSAALPGGYPFNLRNLLTTNWTYSDHGLLFCHRRASGETAL